MRTKYDVSSTRYMVHAAAPCPVETKKMIEWWGDSIWEYYAATEGGGTYVGAAEWMTARHGRQAVADLGGDRRRRGR